MRWWWVRHGPTGSAGFWGWSDPPADLSDEATLSALAAGLPRAPVLSSDLSRARMTADRIAAGRPRLPDARAFREIHFGAWEGLPFAAVAARDPDLSRAFFERPGAVAAPGGESWDDLAARVGAAVDARLGGVDALGRAEGAAAWRAPNLAAGRSPDRAAGPAPDLAAGRAPNLAAGPAPDRAAGPAPDLAAGRAPNLAAWRAPDLAAGRAPGLADPGAQARARAAASDAAAQHAAAPCAPGPAPCADLIVVAHAGVIRAALARAAGLTPAQANAFRIDPLSVTRLDWLPDAAAWAVSSVNAGPPRSDARLTPP